MKIDFFALADTVSTLGWNKAVALVRNGYEADIISELECQLALSKLKELFYKRFWREIEFVNSWETAFYNSAFDLSKPFTLERRATCGTALWSLANRNKNLQSWENVGKSAIEAYTVLGDTGSECIMQVWERV